MNTKLHAVSDAKGRPIGFFMSAGQVSDYTGAAALLGSLPKAGWLLADRGYDADWFRDALKDKGIKVCIPGRKSRKKAVKYDKRRYKRRNRIEIMFGRLKDWTSPLGSNQWRRNGSMSPPDTTGARKPSSQPSCSPQRSCSGYEPERVLTLVSGPIDCASVGCFRGCQETLLMSNLFWLTDAQMARLEPFFPKSHGRPRVDDRPRLERHNLHQSQWVALARCPSRVWPAQDALHSMEALEPDGGVHPNDARPRVWGRR